MPPRTAHMNEMIGLNAAADPRSFVATIVVVACNTITKFEGILAPKFITRLMNRENSAPTIHEIRWVVLGEMIESMHNGFISIHTRQFPLESDSSKEHILQHSNERRQRNSSPVFRPYRLQAKAPPNLRRAPTRIQGCETSNGDGSPNAFLHTQLG